jgi:hypothetical protein
VDVFGRTISFAFDIGFLTWFSDNGAGPVLHGSSEPLWRCRIVRCVQIVMFL